MSGMHVRSVLITGGGSGIGKALATHLAERACRVVIAGRRANELAAVAASSERITAVIADVTDPTDRSVLAAALADLPGPRAVIHAAGYFQAGMLEALTTEDWRRSLETNVEARWALSCACAASLDDGRVLFIGSDAGVNPRAGGAAYSIAQSASDTLRRALQAEWATTSTAVGSFKPGLVDTDMVRGFMDLTADEFPAKAAYDDYVARGQIASPASVARFAAWLLLDVQAQPFADTAWDIRDGEHHEKWANSPLYPNAITSD